MRIETPVKDFNGFRNNVRFVNGVGETDNPSAIEWFRSNGYKVVGEFTTVAPVEKVAEVVEPVEDPVEPTEELCFEDMDATELRQWMMDNGFGAKVRNTRNKEKLLEILRG